MRGTENIIAHIQADAKAEADAILDKAKEQCAEIRRDYEAKAQALYSDKVRAGVKLCEDKAESSERIQQMESKKGLLAVKQEMITRTFETAMDRLLNLPEKDYEALLTKLVVSAATEGDEAVILNAADRAKFGEAVVRNANSALKNGRLTLSDNTGDFKGGVILKRGTVEVNNTLELLVELARNEMSAEIAKVLFA